MSENPSAKDQASKSSEPQKSSKGMMIGLIAGGVLLLACCCTGGVGVGGWFIVMPKFREAAIVGVWTEGQVKFDFRADGKLKKQDFDLVYKFVDANTIEIGPDKQGSNLLNGQPYPTIRYRMEITGDTLKLTETSPPPQGGEAEKYVLKRQ